MRVMSRLSRDANTVACTPAGSPPTPRIWELIPATRDRGNLHPRPPGCGAPESPQQTRTSPTWCSPQYCFLDEDGVWVHEQEPVRWESRPDIAQQIAASAVRHRAGTPDRRAALVERIALTQIHLMGGEHSGRRSWGYGPA